MRVESPTESSILAGLNFLVTTHRMRAPGLTWFRLPRFVWGLYATSLINILGTPVVAITILMVAAERLLHLRYLRRLHVEIERQVVDRGDVASAVHLQVPEHRIGDLSDHEGLE